MGQKLKYLLWTAFLVPLLFGTVEQVQAQAWSVHQGKNNRGAAYARGAVKNGFAEMSLHCVSDNMRSMTLNLAEIPVDAADKKLNKEMTFTLGMDHGGGLIRKVAFNAWYYEGEDTWVGQLPFLTLNQLASFGQAKRFIIWDARGRQIITFSAKGSMKLEEALHGRCYT